MHLAPTLLGSLLLLNGATACRKSGKPQVKFNKRAGRVCWDKLYQCFTQSPALAQEYCTSSLGLPSTTLTVTFTPAPIPTTQEEVVTITSTVQAPVGGAIEKRIASSASKQQLGCAPESTTRIWHASRWTAACSRIGVTSLTFTETTTLEPATVPTVVTITTTVVTTPLTTMTSCPPSPTYNGQPALCYAPSNLPLACQQLQTSAIFSRSLAQSVVFCSQSLTRYGMTLAPDARACFPTSWPANPAATAASSTRSAIYSCLNEPQKSILCQYDAECATATFPVDQVPATPFPAPKPAVGEDILDSTGTFESYGTSLDALYADWAVSGSGWPNHLSLTLSDARSHSGRRSLMIRYLNTSGGGVDLKAFQGRNIPVVPGRRYEFKVWFQHTISAQTNAIYLYVNPVGLRLNEVLGNKPVNQWREASIVFTATTSWVQLIFNFGGNVGGGVCDLYLDDVTLKRLD